jgi:hypothetical protein
VRARFTVENAVAVDYPAPIVVERQEVAHAELTAAAAVVRNTVEREATCVVAAAFHDAAGRLLARPFTVVPLAPSASRPVRFEGPREAVRAEIFVGQVAFH